MLNQPTIEKLHVMKLAGMAEAFRKQMETPDCTQLSFEERFGLLVDCQWTWKENRALTRRLQLAKFKERGVLEDIDYQHQRGLDRKLVRTLAGSEWVRQHHNILFIGPTGIGKTWLACALAHKACRDGFSASHKRLAELFRELALARADGSIGQLLLKLSRIDVLVLDDFAMAPLKDQERRDFLEICDDRYQRRSTILTSQLPVSNWHEQIGDPSIADSIMDRLVHNAYRFELNGESIRKQRGKKPNGAPMSSSPLRLKRASGWFAAGREVQHAALLLSDGAFKLFVWLCLHAERGSGTLSTSIAELARPLHKSPTEIAHHWDELTQAGACCCVGPGRIEIQDRFWPYEREPTDCARQALSAYIAEVRRMFLYPACVHSSFSAADEKIATEWNLRGVSLQQVERAIRLGTVRKYLSLLNNTGGTPITTLHYFAQLIEEVEHTQVSDSYWNYLAYKLRDFERQWQDLNSRTRSRIPETSETK